jgi:LacI family transcriptional regulator
VWPELTTVRQPVSGMAAAALEILLADLRARRRGQRTEPVDRVLDHELIIRGSCGPALAR